MGEILSHAEVEAILAAIEPSRPAIRPTTETPAADPVVWERHDFRHPEALQGAALKVVQALHAGICHRWQGRLELLLQSHINAHPVGACRSTTAEFLATLTTPHVICRVNHANSSAESLLVWSSDLVQSLVSKLLGGADGQVAESTSAMTSIELRLLARLNEAVLGELATLLDDPLTVVAVLQNAQTLPERAAKFPCIWFSVEVAGCGTSGLIHLGIPSISLNSPGQTPPVSLIDSIPPGIQHVCVQVSASLASLKLKTSDLAALQVGDIVMTDLSPSETVSLQLDGHDLCQATIGTHLGRKALRLAEPKSG